MKAISLTQPYATLIALGAKKIETRSWSTSYRGPLAIHAAKNMPLWAKMACFEPQFMRFLEGHALPLGWVIAVCNLTNCKRITPDNTPGEPEFSFGDYTPGRWMWTLENVKEIKPVAVKGKLGLWEWDYVDANQDQVQRLLI